MYCPVDIVSLFHNLDMNGIQRTKGVFYHILY